ncbi:MAG: LysR family transcriptional regulator [Oscillospiraceae bacterium]|nr:LysR family transcriptional regulator [Oscillospiraceae bacterium]
MDIEYLRLFICLAENCSFTNAAKQMYMSLSSFSNKISELEREIGVKLVERTTGSVALTEAGEYFLEDAENIASEKRAADRG